MRILLCPDVKSFDKYLCTHSFNFFEHPVYLTCNILRIKVKSEQDRLGSVPMQLTVYHGEAHST